MIHKRHTGVPRAAAPARRAPARVSCGNCALNTLCLPARLSPEEARILDGVVDRGRQLAAGASLIRAGTHMDALYVVRSGSAKRYAVTVNGTERVHGFVLPGEPVGLEGFASGRFACEATALEPMSYCRIPISKLEPLLEQLPGLRREVLRLLGQELEESLRLRAELGVCDARGRVARFLADLSRRLELRGLSPTQFRLSMSRGDIARHLGLTLETVSRSLGMFKRSGWLEVRARYITLLKPEALASMGGRVA